LIVVDDKSVSGNIALDYDLPNSGKYKGLIASLHAQMEFAFYYQKSSVWFINVGKDQPESARVRARILTLFEGYSYLMISAKGIKAGVGAAFKTKLNLIVAAVQFDAYVNLAGYISFKPLQIGASANLGGSVAVKVLGIKLIKASVNFGFGVDAPSPFRLYGTFSVRVKILFIKLPAIRLEFLIEKSKDKAPLLEPIDILRLPSESESYMPVKATNILSEENFQLNYLAADFTGGNMLIPAPGAVGWRYNFNIDQEANQVTIPLDSFIDIEFLSAVIPTGGDRIGGGATQLADGYRQLVPPQRGLTSQVEHKLELTGLDIYIWGGDNWQPYYVYEAVSAIPRDALPGQSLRTLKDGYWQFQEANKFDRIRLLSQQMFSTAKNEHALALELDALNFNRKDLFCYEDAVRKYTVDWRFFPVGFSYSKGESFVRESFHFTLQNIAAAIARNSTGSYHVLRIKENDGALAIRFPEPLTYFQLRLATNENNGELSFVKFSYSTDDFGKTVVTETVVQVQALSLQVEDQLLTYDHIDQPIDKVVLKLQAKRVLGFEGDLRIGGYLPLPAAGYYHMTHSSEQRKTIGDVHLFGRNLGAAELSATNLAALAGAVGFWNGQDRLDHIGTNHGIAVNNPVLFDAGWSKGSNARLGRDKKYTYVSNADSLLIKNSESIQVENGDFSLVLNAMVSAQDMGISTLMSKCYVHPDNDDKKGFSVHLVRTGRIVANRDYRADALLPGYDIVFTAYNDQAAATVAVSELYVLDCDNGFIPITQFVQVAITVDRATDQLSIYINKVLKKQVAIPAELKLGEARTYQTDIEEIIYMTADVHKRVTDSEMTKEGFIEENERINANLNHTIQPVWRPDSIYAVHVRVRDHVVDGNYSSAEQRHFVYGFKTVGPIGHFHEHDPRYQHLVSQDEAKAYKLANLQNYIDYNRSFPDALGRQDRSKPLFYEEAKIGILFNKAYVNAMFSDWDAYQNNEAVKSRLDISLLAPDGQRLIPGLVWKQLPEIIITDENYRSLPADQQRVYLLNRAAHQEACNPSEVVITRKKNRGEYLFPKLAATSLYTAIAESVYQPAGGQEKKVEVHRFGVMTSRFANFEQQVNSLMQKKADGNTFIACFPILLELPAEQLSAVAGQIWQDSYSGTDPDILRFTDKYDRLLFGGLQLRNLISYEYTVVRPLIQIDPNTRATRILGLLVCNPEPFNHPNLPAEELSDTVVYGKLSAAGAFVQNHAVTVVHSFNLSAVFLSNHQLDLAPGEIVLRFRYKEFNGEDYSSDVVEVVTPPIMLSKENL